MYSKIQKRNMPKNASSDKPKKKSMSVAKIGVVAMVMLGVGALIVFGLYSKNQRRQEMEREFDETVIHYDERRIQNVARHLLTKLDLYLNCRYVADCDLDLRQIKHDLEHDLGRIHTEYTHLSKVVVGLKDILDRDYYKLLKLRREANRAFKDDPDDSSMKEYLASCLKVYRDAIELCLISNDISFEKEEEKSE